MTSERSIQYTAFGHVVYFHYKRRSIEEYHQSMEQNDLPEKWPTKVDRIQSNFISCIGYAHKIRIAMASVARLLNYFALKSKIYIKQAPRSAVNTIDDDYLAVSRIEHL